MITPSITIERIKEYLKEGKRFDGRKLDEFREIFIETDISKKAEGSARVKLGKTEVLVGVKMNVETPYPDSPDSGNLVASVELSPMSSDRFELGPPKIEAIELARIVDRGIRESGVIDLKKLCIKEGEKVWTVYIDIYSINADGNLLDASAIGALVALKNAKIPKYDEKEEKVLFGEWTNKKVPLKNDSILSCTIHKIGDKFILDPTVEEEDASDTRITIALAKDGSIHALQKGGENEITSEELFSVLDLAEKNYKSLYPKIEEAIK